MNKKSLLIVDNEKTIRDSLGKALSKNYQVYESANGKEAIEMIRRKNDIAIVLSDMNMPEMGGIEMTEHLRGENNPVIVIMMSAEMADEKGTEALMSGADFFLPKPIELDTLEKTIRTLLKGNKPLLTPDQLGT